MTMKTMGRIIPDENIWMIWEDSEGMEHSFPPFYYEENGTPVDKYGNDMAYVRTELHEE